MTSSYIWTSNLYSKCGSIIMFGRGKVVNFLIDILEILECLILGVLIGWLSAIVVL